MDIALESSTDHLNIKIKDRIQRTTSKNNKNDQEILLNKRFNDNSKLLNGDESYPSEQV